MQDCTRKMPRARRGVPDSSHPSSHSPTTPTIMMKLLVALLLATSVEGLNTKKQVALKKPLLLRGGAFEAKTALLAQTAGLTAFGTEFILSKWGSTRYWVRAPRYTHTPHIST